MEEVRAFSVVDGIPEGYPDMTLGVLENTPVWGFYTQEWGDEYPTLRARHPVDEPCLDADTARRLQEADPDEFREIGY